MIRTVILCPEELTMYFQSVEGKWKYGPGVPETV